MVVIQLRLWKHPAQGMWGTAEWSCVSALLASGYSALAVCAQRSVSCHNIITVNSAQVSC